MPKHVDTATAAQQLRDSFSTLQLATCSDDGIPHASYTPYVLYADNSFGIMASRLAKHTANLLCHNTCSVLFVENEIDADSPFARRRLTFRCTINHQTRNSPAFTELAKKMQRKFGETASLISQLPDFEVFKLTPCDAEFVEGFGRAWRFKNGMLKQAALIKPDR